MHYKLTPLSNMEDGKTLRGYFTSLKNSYSYKNKNWEPFGPFDTNNDIFVVFFKQINRD